MCDDWDDNPVVDTQFATSYRPDQSSYEAPRENRYSRGGGRNNYGNDGGGSRNNYNNDGGGRNNYNNDRGFNSQPRRTYTNSNHQNQYEPNKRSRDNYGNNDSNEVLKVPSRFVGRIIGRGGSKISELQSQSGARIQVTKETEGEETIVRISGESDAISKAKELILELTVERTQYTEYKAPENNSYEAPQPQQDEAPPPMVDWQTFLKQCEESEKAEWDKYPTIVKEFYSEHPDVRNMSQSAVEEFRESNNNIVVDRTFKTETSRPVQKPCPTFLHSFHNYPEILEEIRKVGFETPSPIQAQAWPVLLSGEDLIGIAQTGTGKTLAFLLPAMIHIDGQPQTRETRGGPAVLIMAPTRELALQIDKEIKKYQYRGINSVCLYGGGSRRDQVKFVTGGVDIIIATPGRLNDLVSAGQLNVKTVTYVVLDEADRMLDMGFEPQIRKVMYMIRPTRQTVMTSATWPPGVRRLAQSYMNDPVQVYVGTLDLAATHTVTQVIKLVPDSDEEKLQIFLEFARGLSAEQKAIVFCGRKARADELASELALAGVHCQTIHGDREQSDREQALIDIKDGTVQILIATDVASRGLDIEDISHVVNYDFPRNIEEYVHRVGRTGRAGKTGESISYFSRADWSQAKELINILEEAQQFVPDEIYQMATRYEAWKERKDAEGGSGRGRFGGGGRGFGGGGSRGGGRRRY